MNFAQYLMMDVTPLWERDSEGVPKSRSVMSEKDKDRLYNDKVMKRVYLYKEALEYFKGSATSVQLGLYLGYNVTSVAQVLKDFVKKTSYIQGMKLTREQCLMLDLKVAKGKLPWLWSYNPNGIIFPRVKDIQ